MKPYRIILADDHALMREGIKSLLHSQEGLQVIAEAGDGIELLCILKKVLPEMVILDIAMPGLRGIEAAQEISVLYPDVAVLFLSMHKSREYLSMAIKTKAKGYLLKQNTAEELLAAIEAIRNGGTYLSPSFADDLPTDIIGLCRGDSRRIAEPLTNRERQVLKLIAEGHTNQHIGELLFISLRTVHRHRDNIRKKLNLTRTADLVKYAIGKGYVSISER
jgi:DNA-binding NarL/FixJ family response regulator